MDDSIHYYAHTSTRNILKDLHTSRKGLTDDEVKVRRKRDGFNILSDKRERGIVLEFLSHFNSPLIIILLVAASVSGFFGEIKNCIIIFVMILVSVTLDFFEEHTANTAAQKLKEKVNTTATVVRNGKRQEIKSSHLCVGDIIFLSAGDLVPADARIIEADDFFVNQSSLTGESFPCEKKPTEDTTREHDTENIIFLGSNVESGTALAVVFHIGKKTEYGLIAEALVHADQKSEFEIGITQFGFFISKIILVLVLIIFLGNAVIHKDILQSFIFAIAIAVGMTPELLPVVMSITMARGAKKMATHGVIVKKLSAIPNFGSMNILCTDKTGTLTKDSIELILCTDGVGSVSDEVFMYTYLNSVHQTGVKNPLDKAVLAYKKIDVRAYKKTEEIPFDFVRKMMSVAVDGPQGRLLITKGAPEAVIPQCTHLMQGKTKRALSASAKGKAYAYYEKLSMDGYRVLALAVKENLVPKEKYTTHDETALTLMGFVAFLDPAKKDVRAVLETLDEYGVEVKVITGDNELVTQKICTDIGMKVKGVLLGKDIRMLTDDALAIKAEQTTIFARFSPDEKNRVIIALRSRGHVVGYLGDGINDAPSLKAADIGISVENAVDIAKETADIILTQKHLKPIIDGIIEGRKAFGNTMKYIMMALSSNFGNMFSVLGALFYLPFLPMLPIQILLNNFIYDISQFTISTDAIDTDWLRRPRKWHLDSVKKFMYVFGPVSSLFDFFTFFILFAVFNLSMSEFQTGWFMESLATQVLVIHIVRTRHLPIIKSRASILLTFSTLFAVVIAWGIPFTPIGALFNFTPLPLPVMGAIVALVMVYLIIVEITKRVFYRKFEL